MEIGPVLSGDIPAVVALVERAFADGKDAKVSDWFSFPEMATTIERGRGVCLVARDRQSIQAVIYAQQENPINGPEGREKWVIVLAAVEPDQAGFGLGSALLGALEMAARVRGAHKMFVYTNDTDTRVIRFYERRGHEVAGLIRDYQHGAHNSAVFLLKHLPDAA